MTIDQAERIIAPFISAESDGEYPANQWFGAMPPSAVLALIDRLRKAEGIVRDLAAKEPVEYYPQGGVWSCLLCGDTNEQCGPSHVESCPYRRAKNLDTAR